MVAAPGRHRADQLRSLKRRLEAAEAANEARAVFLATMSHELREPLNGVLGMARLLCETPLDQEQRGYAEAVVESAGNLITLINDILDLSRIDAGKLELVSTSFALKPFLQRIAKHGEHRAAQKGIVFRAEFPDRLPPILRGDPGRLRQILINLLGNAIKFTSEGEVVLAVRAEPASDQRVSLSIDVSDTGIGIPDELRDRLFTPYAQADPTTPRLFGGSGLGLMISRRLVDAMGGSLNVESHVGKGSRFMLEFGFETPSEVGDDVEHALLAGATLLIVDSQERTRKQTAALATQWGVQVRAIGTGREAVHALDEAADRGEPFDLAIIDQALLDMKGEAIAAQVRDNSKLSTMRLVLLAAYGMRGDAAQARADGFDAYLPKPVTSATLMECLQVLRSGGDDEIITIHSMSERRAPPLDILVVDDNPVNCKLATIMLERAGHRTVVVGNGKDAVDKITECGFDLVLMDVQMPVMDGLEATKQIRELADPARSSVPILAVTANAMGGDDARCREAGMNDYLTKPIDRAHLLTMVSRHGQRNAV